MAIPAMLRRKTFIWLICLGFGSLAASGCSQPKSGDSNSVSTRKSNNGPQRKSLTRLLDVGTGKVSTDSGVVPRFVDVATTAGVDFTRFSDVVKDRFYLPEVMGGGLAWLDFDKDGLLDLYATNGCKLWRDDPQQMQHINRLYRNRDARRFEDVSVETHSTDNRYGQGIAVGDFNGDGFPDLFIANYGRNTLLSNRGDGTFADVTDATGVGDSQWGTSAAWFDANGDGYDDLYVVNYLKVDQTTHKKCQYDGQPGYCGPGSFEGIDDLLYINQGDGRFVERSREMQTAGHNGKGLAIAVCDLNDDRRPEIYLANDMQANFLFTPSTTPKKSAMSKLTYMEVAEKSGCAFSHDGKNEASMGIACDDFDGDGRADLFITHFFRAKNTLYRNLGKLLFEDDSHRTRVAATSFQTLGFGTASIDVDRDGDRDLFIANGHVLGPYFKPSVMRPQLLLNDGRGRFADTSDKVGPYFQRRLLGRGVAAADYDNDGDPDIAVGHIHQPTSLLRNDTTSDNAFIGLHLVTRHRTTPVGTRLVVTSGQHRRVIPIVAGGSYLSSNDPRILVGLGPVYDPVRVEIIWPTGKKQTFERLSTNRYWLIIEGSPPTRTESEPRTAGDRTDM